jgi:hypothetical protein
MPQTISEIDSDGYQIMRLPLEINTSRAGGIKIEKVFISNYTNNWTRYVFKLKDIYCDYSTASSSSLSNAYGIDYVNSISNHLNHIDFHLEKNFIVEGEDFVNFSVSFEPLSQVIVTGYFNARLTIEYTIIQTGAIKEHHVDLIGSCVQDDIQDIDGVPVLSNNYQLSISGKLFNAEGFINIG